MADDRHRADFEALDGVLCRDLFFLCGVIKSGTTWLEKILDSHPEVLCKGEAHFGSDLYPLLKGALEKYNEEMPRKGGAVAHLKQHGGHTDVLSYDDADADFLAVSAVGLMFAKWLRAKPGAKCLGEKTPGNLMHLPLLARWFPSAKFIHVIRDGRDVAVSAWNFNLNTNIGATLRRWSTFDVFAPWFAGAWVDQVMKCRSFGRALGDHYLEIRYEDLLVRPVEEARRLFAALGVDDTTDTVRTCVERCSFEVLSGGRKAGEEDSESFYRKGVAGDWKNHFNEELAASFHRIAGDALKACGYG